MLLVCPSLFSRFGRSHGGTAPGACGWLHPRRLEAGASASGRRRQRGADRLGLCQFGGQPNRSLPGHSHLCGSRGRPWWPLQSSCRRVQVWPFFARPTPSSDTTTSIPGHSFGLCLLGLILETPPPGDHLPYMRYNPPTRTLTAEEHHEYRLMVLAPPNPRDLARAIHSAVWMDPARRPTMVELRRKVCREMDKIHTEGWPKECV